MVRDPPLGKVVRAYALGAITRAHQRAPRLGLFALLLGAGRIKQLGLQQGHGPGLVLVLRAFILAFDHDAGRQVGQAHRRIGLVHMLPAGAGGPVGVDAQVTLVDVHAVDAGGFGQDGDGAGRCVDAALGLRLRHPLHPVGTGFELQAAVYVAAFDAADDFLVAAVLPRPAAEHLQPPTLPFGVLAVHAE